MTSSHRLAFCFFDFARHVQATWVDSADTEKKIFGCQHRIFLGFQSLLPLAYFFFLLAFRAGLRAKHFCNPRPLIVDFCLLFGLTDVVDLISFSYFYFIFIFFISRPPHRFTGVVDMDQSKVIPSAYLERTRRATCWAKERFGFWRLYFVRD